MCAFRQLNNLEPNGRHPQSQLERIAFSKQDELGEIFMPYLILDCKERVALTLSATLRIENCPPGTTYAVRAFLRKTMIWLKASFRHSNVATMFTTLDARVKDLYQAIGGINGRNNVFGCIAGKRSKNGQVVALEDLSIPEDDWSSAFLNSAQSTNIGGITLEKRYTCIAPENTPVIAATEESEDHKQ